MKNLTKLAAVIAVMMAVLAFSSCANASGSDGTSSSTSSGSGSATSLAGKTYAGEAANGEKVSLAFDQTGNKVLATSGGTPYYGTYTFDGEVLRVNADGDTFIFSYNKEKDEFYYSYDGYTVTLTY